MGLRKRVGVMIPSTNTSCEADFRLAAPADFTIHGQRLWRNNAEKTGPDSLDRMNSEIESGARYLATANVDVIAYGCTTGSFYRGAGWDAEMIEVMEREAGVPAIATSPAVVEALRLYGAEKISVASPYPDWNNQKLRPYLEAAGFEVLNVEGEPWASTAGPQGINDQDPEVIVEFAAGVCRAEADVLFCSCTAWRAMEAAEALEERTGKPVITSNQATIWATFRKLGVREPVHGYGGLLENMAAEPVPA